MDKRYLITTPIYYINDKPHIGHTYTTVAADILARWHRLLGYDVMFITGTDENSQKTVEAAEKREQDVREYTDEMAAIWENTWRQLGISFNTFIRTTSDDHMQGVNAFWLKVKAGKQNDQSNIQKGIYQGLYCPGCEAFIKESDLVDGLCPNHKRPPEQLKEENYFFQLQEYRERLLDLLEKNPDFIRPRSRYNEVKNYISEHLEPLSISRSSRKWGIAVPGDDSQVIYVWFDALLNYLTAIGYATREEEFAHWWGDGKAKKIHLVGKDIIKFHCAIWPAMLMAAGENLPDQVFAHGFYTLNGEKISKSLGNVIDPLDLAEQYGFDAVRYTIFREIPFGEDGDFSFERLKIRYEHDLANDLGNLLNRVLVMLEKYRQGKIPAGVTGDKEMIDLAATVWSEVEVAMTEIDINRAYDSIWKLVTALNGFIESTKPWVLAKQDQAALDEVLFTLVEGLRQLSWLLASFLPETAKKMAEQLGYEQPDLFKRLAELEFGSIKAWGELTTDLKPRRGETLFPRLE